MIVAEPGSCGCAAPLVPIRLAGPARNTIQVLRRGDCEQTSLPE